jgi:uncharacterized membrane protein YczE
VLWYVGGFFVLGLGVNIMKASTLGNGAWDTVTINGRAFFQQNVGWEWVTLGMMSLVVSLILFAIVLLYRRELRYLFMLVPVLLVALFIDFWNIVVFQDRLMQTSIWQVLFYVTGVFTLPLGLTLIIKSGFPAFVFDEIMMMFVRITKAKTITFVRLGIELTGIAIGTLFGYLTFFAAEGHFGAVDVGSFVFTLVLAPIMGLWFRILGVPQHA